MADMPFDGYDKMTDDEVRPRIAQRAVQGADGYREHQTVRDFETPQKPNAELIAEYNDRAGHARRPDRRGHAALGRRRQRLAQRGGAALERR